MEITKNTEFSFTEAVACAVAVGLDSQPFHVIEAREMHGELIFEHVLAEARTPGTWLWKHMDATVFGDNLPEDPDEAAEQVFSTVFTEACQAMLEKDAWFWGWCAAL